MVCSMDDDSDFVKDKELERRNEKMQVEAENSAQLLKVNWLVVAGEKN